MKRRMLSALLSVLLVIATICVSNMPSRAVEPEDEVARDEMMTAEDETGTVEAPDNSEVTATGEAMQEATEMTKEELTEERAATSLLENYDVTATEEAAEDETRTTEALNNSDVIVTDETTGGMRRLQKILHQQKQLLLRKILRHRRMLIRKQ